MHFQLPLLATYLLLVTNLPVLAQTRHSLAGTPPMGFNSWYMRGADIDQALIKGMADFLLTNHLDQFGYRYVVIDEGWTYPYGHPNGRAADGEIVPDPSRFPDLPALVDYIHTNGLNAGIYTEDTFEEANGFIGSAGHLEQDAATYARWGFDFVKYDVYDLWNYLEPLRTFADALDAQPRPLVLYAGVNAAQHGGADRRVLDYANCYRFVGDVVCSYERFTNVLFLGASLQNGIGPGRWIDLDTLFWRRSDGISTKAARTSMGMLSILSAPLMIPAFLNPALHGDILTIITNSEVIAIDQDPAGAPARCVGTNRAVSTWVKSLASPDTMVKAVALLNLDTQTNRSVQVSWQEIGLPEGVATVRDLWDHRTTYETNGFVANVPSGDLAIFRISAGVEPIFAPGITYLSDLRWLDTSFNGSLDNTQESEYGPPLNIYRDGCADGYSGVKSLELGGTKYRKGLGLFPNGHIEFYLGGLAKRFHCVLGVDDIGRRGFARVKFVLHFDNRKMVETDALTAGDAPMTVDLSAEGVAKLAIDTLSMKPDGTIWGNFADVCDAYIEVPEKAPDLRIVRAPEALTLSWPSNAQNWEIEFSPTLNDANWKLYPVAPETQAGRHVLQVTNSTKSLYFRLHE